MRPRRIYRWFDIVLLLVAIGTILALVVPVLLTTRDTFGIKHPDLDYITNYTEITFPPSSSIITAR